MLYPYPRLPLRNSGFHSLDAKWLWSWSWAEFCERWQEGAVQGVGGGRGGFALPVPLSERETLEFSRKSLAPA